MLQKKSLFFSFSLTFFYHSFRDLCWYILEMNQISYSSQVNCTCQCDSKYTLYNTWRHWRANQRDKPQKPYFQAKILIFLKIILKASERSLSGLGVFCGSQGTYLMIYRHLVMHNKNFPKSVFRPQKHCFSAVKANLAWKSGFWRQCEN